MGRRRTSLYWDGFTAEELSALERAGFQVKPGRVSSELDDEAQVLRILIRRLLRDESGRNGEGAIDHDAIGRTIDRLARLIRTRAAIGGGTAEADSLSAASLARIGTRALAALQADASRLGTAGTGGLDSGTRATDEPTGTAASWQMPLPGAGDRSTADATSIEVTGDGRGVGDE